MRQFLCFLLGLSCLHALSAQSFDPGRITLVRDSFGVPHIFAPTDAEVAYGLAWATMEDDVDNAQFMLAAMRGVLGKRIGMDGVKVDYAVQLMGVLEQVEKRYQAEIPEDFKRVVEGYAAGANAYFRAHPERLWFPEMLPVKPQDLIAGTMLGNALMGGIDGTINRILNGGILNDLPPRRGEDGRGSNAFAFHPSRTTDGNAYLAVNAHQPVEGLLSWYEAHLCSDEGWNIIGALFHGAPTVYLGTNEHLGWAHTTGQLDEEDVFMLRMKSPRSNRYAFDGKWLRLKTHYAKLRVPLGKKKKFILHVRKKYWNSVYGPTLKTKHGTFAIRMPALIELKPALQWYRMNKARNFTEFRHALEVQGLSRQNITYADGKDTIFFLSNGLIPDRNRNFNWEKVVPGDTSATLWTRYMPIDSLAWFLNPECGFVFNVNNAGFEATCVAENEKLVDFNPHIGYREEVNNRSLRVYELMAEYDGRKISWEDFHRIKFDHTYPRHITFQGDFWLDDLFTLEESRYPDIADAITHLKAWDHCSDTLDKDASVLMFTIYELLSVDRGTRRNAGNDKALREQIMVESVRKAKAHMMKHFGTTDIDLGKVQVLEKFGKSMGISGGPDAIRAVMGTFMDDGRLRMRVGDSYVQMVKFTPEGPVIQSVHAFGASNDPENPHSTDQMEMFVRHRLKPVTLDRETVMRTAERTYHPQ